MKTIFPVVSIPQMLFQLFENSPNRINVICFIGVDRHVNKINNDKVVQLLDKNFINIALKTCWSVGEVKWHYLILKVAVLIFEHCLLFISLTNPHPMIWIGLVKLCEKFGPTQPIQKLTNEGQRVLIFNSQVVEILVVDIQPKTTIKLLDKQDRSIYKRFGRAYKPIDQVSFDLSL